MMKLINSFASFEVVMAFSLAPLADPRFNHGEGGEKLSQGGASIATSFASRGDAIKNEREKTAVPSIPINGIMNNDERLHKIGS